MDFIGENMDLFEEKIRKVFPEIPKVLQKTILLRFENKFSLVKTKRKSTFSSKDLNKSEICCVS
jgi:hypothetical protein